MTPLVLLALVELGAELVDGSLGMAHGVRPRAWWRTHRGFRYAQIVTFGTMALGHGMQDAQQTMRSITLACSPVVGAPRRLSAVRRGVAGNIVVAWVVTLPAAGSVAAVAYKITDFFVG